MKQAPSPFVMVPREVMERIEFASNGYCPACDGWMVDKWRGATPGKHAPKCELAKALTVIPVGVDQKRACIEGAVTAESAETKSAGGESTGVVCRYADGCSPFGGPCPSCRPIGAV